MYSRGATPALILFQICRSILSWIGDQTVPSGEVFSRVLEPLGGGPSAQLRLSYSDGERGKGGWAYVDLPAMWGEGGCAYVLLPAILGPVTRWKLHAGVR